MYFLLSQLSFTDVLYISTIVPKMLVDYLLIDYPLYGYLTLVGAECFQLGFMAICSPLTYSVLMNHQICWVIIAGFWFGGSLDGFLLTPITMSFPFYSSRKIDHFFCKAPVVLKLACAAADTPLYEIVMYMCCVLMLLIPFSVVIASYVVHYMSSVGEEKSICHLLTPHDSSELAL